MALRRCLAGLLILTTLALGIPQAARAQGVPEGAPPPQVPPPQGAPPQAAPPGPPGPYAPYGPPPVPYNPYYNAPYGPRGAYGQYAIHPAEALYRSGRRMQIAGIALTITGVTLGVLAGVLIGTRAHTTNNEIADTTINVFKEVFGYLLLVGGIATFVPGVILWPVGVSKQDEARRLGFRGYADAEPLRGPSAPPPSLTAGLSLRLSF